MMYGSAVTLYLTKDNLAIVSFCIFAIGINGPFFAQLIDLIRYQDDLKIILHKLEYELIEKYQITNDEKIHIQRAEKLVKRYLSGYMMFTFFGCLAFLGIPLWKKLLIYFGFLPSTISVGTPNPAWMPFDTDSYYGYFMVYLLEVYHFYSLWTVWVGVDILSAGIIFHICAHISIISGRIINWVDYAKVKSFGIEIDRDELDLRKIISYHLEILK